MAVRRKKARTKRVKKHAALRMSCKHCGEPHSVAVHLSHGKGSYRRTHKRKTKRRRK